MTRIVYFEASRYLTVNKNGRDDAGYSTVAKRRISSKRVGAFGESNKNVPGDRAAGKETLVNRLG
jgi:hypothetical protein